MEHKRKRLARRAALAGALVACAAALLPSAAPARPTVGSPCEGAAGARCLTVAVPLDRSGRVPGKVSLHVTVLPAFGTQRGVMFLIAGGPGQAATELFDFRQPLIRSLYNTAFPGYTLVSFDARGTGRSGALRCPTLEADRPDEGAKVASCAKALGPRRDFYGTPDQAADVDSVRQALGYDAIGLAGVSYGTELAVEYARAYPDHVDRLMLDSVALLGRPDPFATGVLSHVPATLRRFCAGGECRTATPDFAGDVTAVARKLEAGPLRGTVLQRGGGHRTASLGKGDFLSLLLDSDLSVGLALELPAAVHAARGGNPGPILRLANLDAIGGGEDDLGVNDGVYLATVCRDGGFPWQPDTALAKRRELVAAAVRALPARQLGGFGRWATEFGSAASCLEWPSPSGGTERSTAPLPDVPVLALSGAFDLRTPTDNAATLVKQFRNARLVVVPRVGHSALTNDLSGCAIRAVRAWAQGETVQTQCPRIKPLFPSVPAYASVAVPVGAQRTLDLAEATLREAVATWLMTGAIDGKKTTVAGLAHGTATSKLSDIELDGYASVPGVWLTGRISLSLANPYAGFSGSLAVTGPNAARGTLTVDGESLRGDLGGKSVGS